jgi:hypothetical protein
MIKRPATKIELKYDEDMEEYEEMKQKIHKMQQKQGDTFGGYNIGVGGNSEIPSGSGGMSGLGSKMALNSRFLISPDLIPEPNEGNLGIGTGGGGLFQRNYQSSFTTSGGSFGIGSMSHQHPPHSHGPPQYMHSQMPQQQPFLPPNPGMAMNPASYRPHSYHHHYNNF